MEESYKRIECASLKSRIEMLDKLLYYKIYEKYKYDPYHYHLHIMAINDMVNKLDKLENKYYSKCFPSKKSSTFLKN